MIQLRTRGILLDIEGTTSSIRFVYDEMFPFVRRELAKFLTAHAEEASVADAAEQIARDAGFEGLDALVHRHDASLRSASLNDPAVRQALEDEVLRQMDSDWKTTGLKQLQGLIWKAGFESGELHAHLYPEVADRLRAWHQAGFILRIYSSGSIAAQLLFFGHTIAGDLLALFSGHDDTTTGSKKEVSSYRQIVDKFGLMPSEIVFISDSLEELHAAEEAGLQVVWSRRAENPNVDAPSDFPSIRSFDELNLSIHPGAHA